MKPKVQDPTHYNKMDEYAVQKQSPTSNGSGATTPEEGEPSLKAIMAAISDLKSALEPKLDTVTEDVLRADFQKISDKISTAESDIKVLQTASKKLEEQVKYLTKQTGVLAARQEDQEGRARRNNIRVFGVPEKTEGPSVDLFLEDLIVNILPPKHLSKFFSVERAHRAPIPLPKPPPRTILARIFNHRDHDAILHAARTHGDVRLDNATVQFSQTLTSRDVAQLACGVSDYSPVMAILVAIVRDTGLPPRIDPWYLKKGDFPDRLREGAKRYFDDNLGSVTSEGILLEAFKTVIRGQTQALIGGLKKERCLKCETIEGEVSELEAEMLAGGPIQLHQYHNFLLKQQEVRDLEGNKACTHTLAM
ncbi:hypothetical protein NDU88_011766 [Pleurodeles waltl]|uniref:Uncharacterized protein n=1 Tax=Pleurodeles waltl TaxID=8319 RepID=A0AAV7S251_PLEWA|nr:hypothetical protein NDU88_011766 [Pleurodeles waltl]